MSLRRSSLLAAVVLAELAFTSSFASAADLSACDFKGRFRAFVSRAVAAQLLPAASYGAMIVRGDGTVLCQEDVNADLSMAPASTIKALVAVAVLRKVDRGEVRLADLVTINQPNAAAECADWNCAFYGPGKRLSVQRLLTDMIRASNNLATNQLADVATKPFLADTAQRLGAPSLQFLRKLYSRQPAEPTIVTPNQGNARGFLELYRELATGRLGVLTPASRSFLNGLLSTTFFKDRLNYYFPASVTFFHKIGNTSQVSADAGFYRLGPNTFVVLAGLQNFVNYAPLRNVGKWTLDLTKALR